MEKSTQLLIEAAQDMLQTTNCKAIRAEFYGGGDSGDIQSVYFEPDEVLSVPIDMDVSSQEFADLCGLPAPANDIRVQLFTKSSSYYINADGESVLHEGYQPQYLPLLDAISEDVFTLTDHAGLSGFEDNEGGTGTVIIGKDGSLQVIFKDDSLELESESEEMLDKSSLSEETLNNIKVFLETNGLESFLFSAGFNSYDGVSLYDHTTVTFSKDLKPVENSEIPRINKQIDNNNNVQHISLHEQDDLSDFITDNLLEPLTEALGDIDEDRDDGGAIDFTLSLSGDIKYQISHYTSDNNEEQFITLIEAKTRKNKLR